MRKRFFTGLKSFEIFFWLYFVWYYLPIARAYFHNSFYSKLFFGFFVVGIALCVLTGYSRSVKLKLNITPIWPVLVYMLSFLLMVILERGTADRHIRVSFSFWGTLLVYYLISKYPDVKRRLVKLFFLMFLVTMLTSVIGVLINGSAARLLAYASNDIEEDLAIRLLNIGSISFFQGLVICVPICGTFLYRGQYRSYCVAILITIFIGTIAASFAISVLMLLIAFLITYWINNASSKNILIGTFLLLLVLLIPWGNLLLNFAQVIGNETFAVRLEAIAKALTTGAITGNLESRLDVYAMSLDTFLNNPLGVGPEYTYVTGQDNIGYHSQILDDLARYGIFAVAFYATYLVTYYKLLYKQWGKVQMSQIAMPVTLLYFGFLVLNLGFTSAHESILMLFLIPSFPEILCTEPDYA